MKQRKKITKFLLENQCEVYPTKKEDDTHPKTEQTKVDIPSIMEVQSIEQAVGGTSGPKVQSIEHVEVNIPKEGRAENDVGVGKVVITDKVEIPLTPEKEEVAKENVEKIEVKIEARTEARDTTKTVKGKQVIDDPKFIQGPINLASLSPIQKLELESFAQDKASEDVLKYHTEDSLFVMPTKNTLDNLRYSNF